MNVTIKKQASGIFTIKGSSSKGTANFEAPTKKEALRICQVYGFNCNLFVAVKKH